ncbi:hypothetical protein KAW08_05850 [bacterium]|nr:hypothetical protein [bacterium]
MKTKIAVLTFLVLVSVIFLLIPYKFYDSHFLGFTPNCSSTIAEEFSGLFDGNWLRAVAFVFVFFPIVLTLEILFSKDLSSKKWKIILVVQGLAGVLATYAIYWIMTFPLFETNIKLTPICYLSLIWVGIFSFSSILFAIPKINVWIMKNKTI